MRRRGDVKPANVPTPLILPPPGQRSGRQLGLFAAALPGRDGAPEPLRGPTSPNTGGPLSAVEVERLTKRRPLKIVGRMIQTDREYFACQMCVQKFIVDPGFGEPDPNRPWPAGPCEYRLFWESPAGEGERCQCVWCGRAAVGEPG